MEIILTLIECFWAIVKVFVCNPILLGTAVIGLIPTILRRRAR